MSRLRLNFNHLNRHKFRNSFNDTVDPMCTCGLEQETTLHYLLHYNLYSVQRLELLGTACDLNLSLKSHSDENFLNVLLYGSEEFNCNMNKEILKAEIKFLKSSERFNDPPFIILKIFLVLMVLTFRICFSFVLILDIYAELTLSGTWLSVSYLSCVVLF